MPSQKLARCMLEKRMMNPASARWILNVSFLTTVACSSAPLPENKQNTSDVEQAPEESPEESPEEAPSTDEGTGGKVNDPAFDPCPPCDIIPSVAIRSGDEVVRLPYLPDTYFAAEHQERCVRRLTLNTIHCFESRSTSLSAGEHPVSLEDDGQPSPGARLDLSFFGYVDEPIVKGDGTFRDAQGTVWTLGLVDELPTSYLDEGNENHVQATLNYIGWNSEQESKSFRVTFAVCVGATMCLVR